jgi:hypothetical protein
MIHDLILACAFLAIIFAPALIATRSANEEDLS